MSAASPLVIVDYDPAWPTVFEGLKGVLARTLGDTALAIEHVGSTSVPRLAAKAIIDIDVVIDSQERLPEVIRRLRGLGYFHEGDLGITGREAFGRSGSDVPRDGTGRAWFTHHLYVCPHDSPELTKHLAFRDYLRGHPERARAYGDLKRDLAQRFTHDRDGYSRAKASFVDEVLRKALAR